MAILSAQNWSEEGTNLPNKAEADLNLLKAILKGGIHVEGSLEVARSLHTVEYELKDREWEVVCSEGVSSCTTQHS